MRALVVGGGCRGLDLARALTAEGHAVRIVTRRPEARAAIGGAGAGCFAGDPDVVGTLRYALEGVTILLWLLGTASGPADKLAALHGSRLRMMLSRTTDTTVRGVVYEGPYEDLARRSSETWQIPLEIVTPAEDAKAAVDRLLGV